VENNPVRHALQILNGKIKELESDPLYRWIREFRHTDPRRNLDSFLPLLSMTLTFPFYNSQYLAYDGDDEDDGRSEDAASAAAIDQMRSAINEHAQEDRTHAALFLKDARSLDLAKVWGIDSPSLLLWIVWVSPMQDPAQRVFAARARAIVAAEDQWPPFRYLHVEQIEADGNFLFSASTSQGEAIKRATGAESLYFAHYHLGRESGHVGGKEYEQVVLTPAQARHAGEIIEQKHKLSVEMNQVTHQFARDAERCAHPASLMANEKQQCMAHVRKRVDAFVAGKLPAPAWHIRPLEDHQARRRADRVASYPAQSTLIKAWHRHYQELLDHPFVPLFREARGNDATYALRCAALLYANRVCSLHAFYKFDCKTENPRGPGSEVVDFIGETFATEAQLFFHDWDVLEMDRLIPWDMADLAEWLFFHPKYGRPELEALHEFRREALRINDDPLIKYWAMMSVHFMSRAFFSAAIPAAEAFGREHPDRSPLVFFRGVHHLLYEQATPSWSEPGHPTHLCHLPCTREQRQYILNMMQAFARYGQRQFNNLAKALTTDRAAFAFLSER
jgi:hypothetical protein